MELVTKEYLEDNIKTYDTYRGLNKIGSANGIATLDANGKVPVAQIPSGIANDVTYNNNTVTSLVAGTNTSMSISNGALTINSTAATSTDITNAINALDVSDSAVSGKYVSAVSETNGKITVTRANLPTGLPSYSSSNKGKVLKVNSNGNGVEWGDAPSSGNKGSIVSISELGVNSNDPQNKVSFTITFHTDYNKVLIENGTTFTISPIEGVNNSKLLNMSANGTRKITPLGDNHKIGDTVLINISNFQAGTSADDSATANLYYWYL